MNTRSHWLFRARLSVFCMAGVLASAFDAVADESHVGGITHRLVCGGNFSASQASSWTFHNHNEQASISFQRMRIYDARGGLLYDSMDSGLAEATNGVLGPADPVLEAFQTVNFSSDRMLADGLLVPIGSDFRPVTLIVDTLSAPFAHPLAGTLTRITRDSGSGQETARTAMDCRELGRGRSIRG